MFFFSIVLWIGAATVNAKIICQDNASCDEGLICESGFCTSPLDLADISNNPFETGCLRIMAEREGRNIDDFKIRVCNSDDIAIGNTANCLQPEFNYMETRMAPWNWESGT